MTGIADDVLAGLMGIFLRNGAPVRDRVKTNGDGTAAGGGGLHPIGKNVNWICPAVTLINNGASTFNWGFVNADMPLAPGASITFRWKNIASLHLVVNDLGAAAVADLVG